MNLLQIPITELMPCSNETRAALIRKELHRLNDLLFYFPKRYEDRDSLLTVANVMLSGRLHEPNFAPTIMARCIRRSSFSFRNREIRKYFFSDDQTEFSISAYNPYQRFKLDEYYMLSGKLLQRKGELQMNLREYENFDREAVESLNLGRIVGVYSTTEHLSQKQLRSLIKKAITEITVSDLPYLLPASLVRTKALRPKLTNIRELHFPEGDETLKRARHELAYEELFVLEQKLAKTRQVNIQGKENARYPLLDPLKTLMTKMAFKLTKDQEQALEEILDDMTSKFTMQRLLHGEVSSGKTLVAALSMYLAHSNGHQSVLLAPTEILVHQHVKFFKDFFNGLSVPIAMLVASGHRSKEAHHENLHIIKNYPNAMIIGTHAIIQKKSSFPNLRYVIIDEQHRFGVEQRQALIEKGEHPDFLSLSATPIPRSLCLTLYGDLSVSKLHTRAQGSADIQTKVIREGERPHAYSFLKQRIKRHQEQGYVIFPVIEESSTSRLRSLKKEFAILKERVFQDIPIALIHGKIKTPEKEDIMQAFHAGEIRILFATTVLEVGIDHPNATVMIIESAYQFGLSQLHQLRGRVGRHHKPGYCYMITQEDSEMETVERLERFATMKNGFEIAELDLRLRGPGEMTGQRQSGISALKVADLIRDEKILIEAREDAYRTVFNTSATN